MTEQQADIRARIAALRAMRQLARQHGDSDKVIELTNEMGKLTQDARKLQREEQEPMP